MRIARVAAAEAVGADTALAVFCRAGTLAQSSKAGERCTHANSMACCRDTACPDRTARHRSQIQSLHRHRRIAGRKPRRRGGRL